MYTESYGSEAVSSVQIVDIREHHVYINAMFANLNKNDSIEEYDEQLEAGKYYLSECKIDKVVVLDTTDYDLFCESLLSDCDWLEDEGGTSLNSATNSTYRHVVAVACKNRRTLYVDPQGYSYARYVGVTTF